MSRRTPEEARRIAESLGPAEKLVQLIINFRTICGITARASCATESGRPRRARENRRTQDEWSRPRWRMARTRSESYRH
jgi:hypothetical protein